MRFGAKVQGLVRGPCAHSLSRTSLGTGLDYGLGDPRTDQEQKPEMGEVGPGYSQPPKLELSPSVHLILTAAFYLLRASTLTIPYAWNAVPPRCMNFGFSQNSGLPREAYPDHRGSTRATPCDAHRARLYRLSPQGQGLACGLAVALHSMYLKWGLVYTVGAQ